MVCGQPALLAAPVLKTVLRNPGRHFPPPDPGAVAMVEVCCGFAEAMVEGCCWFPVVTGPGPEEESEVWLESDLVSFATPSPEPPFDPSPQPGI